MLTVYGIPNCDKCRAARRWFEQMGRDFNFHDVRAEGLSTDLLSRWQKNLGPDTLLNRRGQTWRAIPAALRQDLDADSVRALILEYPTVMKRPIVDDGVNVRLGYDETEWKRLFL